MEIKSETKKKKKKKKKNDTHGGYIFYAGGSMAGAGYCWQCCRRPAILLVLQLWQDSQGCVTNFRPTTSKNSPI